MLFTHKYTEHGFSLIELLIVLAISSILFATIINTFITQRKSYALQEQITDMVQGARAAMVIMTREIRMAGYTPSGADIEGITNDTAATCQTLNPGPRISADLNGDGDTDDINEKVTYCYDATQFQITRNTGGGNQPFTENVQTVTFEYLDSTGNPTVVVADIRQLRVTVTARTAKPDANYHNPYDPANNYRTYTLRALVIPRNLAL